MRRITSIILCAVALTVLAAGCKGQQGGETQQDQIKQKQDLRPDEEQMARLREQLAAIQKEQAKDNEARQVQQMDSTGIAKEPIFNIETNYGPIKVKLYSKTPRHRANFITLAMSGFYDSTLFHRVVDGFIIQAGDPNTRDSTLIDKWGKGGPGYNIDAEFVPEYWHRKGALCAARTGDKANPMKESNGSQFYLVVDEMACLTLDGQYTVFGETVDGFRTIEAISKVKTDKRDRPLQEVKILSIRVDEASIQKKSKQETENTETADDIVPESVEDGTEVATVAAE